jgi:methionine transaminase
MTFNFDAGTKRLALKSKLPQVGETIFSTMSALALQHQAINLGQGFPDFGSDPALLNHVTQAMQEGCNQYAPMAGVLLLRERIAKKTLDLYGRSYDPVHEITVTNGASQAIFTILQAIVQPGDEVIVLDPCYDSYDPSIQLAGGKAVHVQLIPLSFAPDLDGIRAALSPRTRALILNTPHNPTATVWTQEQMRALADLLASTQVLLISDEVYEHMVFDDATHQSVARHADLAERAYIVSSFGKTFHVTGWKVGYVLAPADLMREYQKAHQFNVFCVATPLQHGLARYLADPAPYLELPKFYQRKRDFFRQGLLTTRFKLLPCQGSYFQCVDYSSLSDLSEVEFCQWLTRQAGVAAIPLSVFYQQPTEQKLIRFCFAKKDATLETAIERLAKL